ncbi:hypothetical protein ACLOJK_012814 [Asimina triloba]
MRQRSKMRQIRVLKGKKMKKTMADSTKKGAPLFYLDYTKPRIVYSLKKGGANGEENALMLMAGMKSVLQNESVQRAAAPLGCQLLGWALEEEEEDARRADLIAALGETNTGKPAFQRVLDRTKKSTEGQLKRNKSAQTSYFLKIPCLDPLSNENLCSCYDSIAVRQSLRASKEDRSLFSAIPNEYFRV